MRMCRKIETALFIAAVFFGLISPKICGALWVILLGVMIIHSIVNKKYAQEWANYIFK